MINIRLCGCIFKPSIVTFFGIIIEILILNGYFYKLKSILRV